MEKNPNTELIERRAHARFQARGRALVMIPHGTLPYHIIDLSISGLAIRYIGKEKRFAELSELNIFWGEELFLEKMPVTSISDFALDKGHIPMRRLGVKFGELSSYQRSQPDIFIRNYTLAAA